MLNKMLRWTGLLLLSLPLLSGCGFHLKQTTEIPAQFRTMTFHSDNPYGPLSRTIKTSLLNNQVQLIDDTSKQYPAMQILGSDLRKNTISVYPDGKAAEYQLLLKIDVQIVMPQQDIYPLTVKVFRTFFDNPAAVLAKDSEQMLIEKEMYQQAADQLINKLKTISVLQKTYD